MYNCVTQCSSKYNCTKQMTTSSKSQLQIELHTKAAWRPDNPPMLHKRIIKSCLALQGLSLKAPENTCVSFSCPAFHTCSVFMFFSSTCRGLTYRCLALTSCGVSDWMERLVSHVTCTVLWLSPLTSGERPLSGTGLQCSLTPTFSFPLRTTSPPWWLSAAWLTPHI